MNEQQSLFPEAKAADSCYMCRYFRELKEPWTRSDKNVIYGYCFKGEANMGKGYAVFLPEGKCRNFSRKRMKK